MDLSQDDKKIQHPPVGGKSISLPSDSDSDSEKGSSDSESSSSENESFHLENSENEPLNENVKTKKKCESLTIKKKNPNENQTEVKADKIYEKRIIHKPEWNEKYVRVFRLNAREIGLEIDSDEEQEDTDLYIWYLILKDVSDLCEFTYRNLFTPTAPFFKWAHYKRRIFSDGSPLIAIPSSLFKEIMKQNKNPKTIELGAAVLKSLKEEEFLEEEAAKEFLGARYKKGHNETKTKTKRKKREHSKKKEKKEKSTKKNKNKKRRLMKRGDDEEFFQSNGSHLLQVANLVWDKASLKQKENLSKSLLVFIQENLKSDIID